MLKAITGFILVPLTTLMLSPPVLSQDVPRETRSLEVAVNQQTGHLLNWSATDRRIKSIMIDNPESLQKNIVFNVDGCTRQLCSNDASLVLISPRPGAKVGVGGTIRVITYDPKNRLFAYTIKINITDDLQQDAETRFTIVSRNTAKS